jgi:hypothetical protein
MNEREIAKPIDITSANIRQLLDHSVKLTAQKYAAIGKFVIEFEMIVHVLRAGIATLFQVAGTTPPKLTVALVGNRSVTAGPMLEMYVATIGHVHTNAEVRSVLKWLQKEINPLIADRNDIVHGTWFIDPTDLPAKPEIKGYKHRSNADGIDMKALPKSVAEFEALCQRCRNAYKAVNALTVCLSRKIPISTYLHKQGKGYTASLLPTPA